MTVFFILVGFIAATLAVLTFGIYTVGPTQRGVITSFGRVQRIGRSTTAEDPVLGADLTDTENARYDYPVIKVVQPGGPYFKWPWQRVRKVDMTIKTTDINWDPDKEQRAIESVTKDNLTVDVSGQIR